MEIYRNLIRPNAQNVVGRVTEYHYQEPIEYTNSRGLVQVVDAHACPIPTHGERIREAWATDQKAWVEVPEEYYEGVLEATPPATQRALGFVAGEPYSATDEGDTLYLCLLECRDKDGGRKWIAKVCTLAEWRSAYRLAIYEELVNPCT